MLRWIILNDGYFSSHSSSKQNLYPLGFLTRYRDQEDKNIVYATKFLWWPIFISKYRVKWLNTAWFMCVKPYGSYWVCTPLSNNDFLLEKLSKNLIVDFKDRRDDYDKRNI